jgi:hypothetical protein
MAGGVVETRRSLLCMGLHLLSSLGPQGRRRRILAAFFHASVSAWGVLEWGAASRHGLQLFPTNFAAAPQNHHHWRPFFCVIGSAPIRRAARPFPPPDHPPPARPRTLALAKPRGNLGGACSGSLETPIDCCSRYLSCHPSEQPAGERSQNGSSAGARFWRSVNSLGSATTR